METHGISENSTNVEGPFVKESNREKGWVKIPLMQSAKRSCKKFDYAL